MRTAAFLTCPIAELDAAFSYDPETGELRWRKRPRSAFATAWGYQHQTFYRRAAINYRQVALNGRAMLVSRVCYAIYYRRWPSKMVDHIDGDSTNNRISNLREASNAQNTKNRKRHYNNKAGHKGVSWHNSSGKWQAQICIDYHNIYLGLFDTPELAAAAYQEAAVKYHGKFARLS